MVSSYRYSTLHCDIEQLNAFLHYQSKETEKSHDFIQCTTGGKEITAEKYFCYYLLFQEISSYILFLFSSFCFKGHTPSSNFIFFFPLGDARMDQNKLHAERLSSHPSSQESRLTKQKPQTRAVWLCWLLMQERKWDS